MLTDVVAGMRVATPVTAESIAIPSIRSDGEFRELLERVRPELEEAFRKKMARQWEKVRQDVVERALREFNRELPGMLRNLLASQLNDQAEKTAGDHSAAAGDAAAFDTIAPPAATPDTKESKLIMMELAKSFEPKNIEAHWYPQWESAGYFRARNDCRQGSLLHHAAAAECHRHAAHGPCVPGYADGCADPLPPHEGRQYPVAARHRPCRHRDADRGRAPARCEKYFAARTGPREIPREGVGMEGAFRFDHHPPDAPSRRFLRLVARTLYHGRGFVGSGHRSVRQIA